MNRAFTAKELRIAAARLEDCMMAGLAREEAEPYDFSPAFHMKMEPVLARARRQERSHRAIQTIAASVAVILICGFSWLATHAQARDAVQRWIRETWRNSIVYRFLGEESSTVPEVRPAWLPEGYEETMALEREGWLSVTYRNENGDCIFFDVHQMHEGTMVDFIANPGEEHALEKVDVGGLPGEIYMSGDRTEQSVLIWMDDEMGFCYELDAKLDASVILHIAESVPLVNPTK